MGTEEGGKTSRGRRGEEGGGWLSAMEVFNCVSEGSQNAISTDSQAWRASPTTRTRSCGRGGGGGRGHSRSGWAVRPAARLHRAAHICRCDAPALILVSCWGAAAL